MNTSTEFKKGVYKFRNGEFDEAKKIFEDLAFGYNFGEAWVYLGALKIIDLESGATTVQQALGCFEKADQLSPERVNEHQALYSDFVFPMIKYFGSKYSESRSGERSAKRKTFGNLALGGLSLLLGSQAKKSNGKLLGVAGGILGAYSADQNRQKAGEMVKLTEFYKDIIRQLVLSATSYCRNNREVYLNFQSKINELREADKILAPLLESGMNFIPT